MEGAHELPPRVWGVNGWGEGGNAKFCESRSLTMLEGYVTLLHSNTYGGSR